MKRGWISCALRRSLFHGPGRFLLPLALWLSMPFVCQSRWSRLFWTYISPAISAFLMWNAFASCLRTYSVEELQGLVDGLRYETYSWEIGVEAARPAPISYLIGYPNQLLGSPRR